MPATPRKWSSAGSRACSWWSWCRLLVGEPVFHHEVDLAEKVDIGQGVAAHPDQISAHSRRYGSDLRVSEKIRGIDGCRANCSHGCHAVLDHVVQLPCTGVMRTHDTIRSQGDLDAGPKRSLEGRSMLRNDRFRFRQVFRIPMTALAHAIPD